MYFYIFIVMYLTRSLSNAFLFLYPPMIDQDSKFSRLASLHLKRIFNDNVHNDRGMDLITFKALMYVFKPVHELNDIDIEKLFHKEILFNVNVFMSSYKFLKRIFEVTKKVEHKLKTIYENHVNQDGKMTKQTFIEAIKVLSMCDITQNEASETINVEGADPQNISFTEEKLYLYAFSFDSST
ncbi:uncharacterized protein LOC126910369 isoform X2 [Daktulosphaira vitifoliae]|uniref:uncharacterized protein LOC126910369 isoform X2 n=1 Tax=Daktulosphaira vitifoliae TaxID=58002 RepID=UPI0021AAF9EE|nr:uncharacterized protein LOC126910369 isoform X2 [Daktulosphaira vitifoliae]